MELTTSYLVSGTPGHDWCHHAAQLVVWPLCYTFHLRSTPLIPLTELVQSAKRHAQVKK